MEQTQVILVRIQRNNSHFFVKIQRNNSSYSVKIQRELRLEAIKIYVLIAKSLQSSHSDIFQLSMRRVLDEKLTPILKIFRPSASYGSEYPRSSICFKADSAEWSYFNSMTYTYFGVSISRSILPDDILTSA